MQFWSQLLKHCWQLKTPKHLLINTTELQWLLCNENHLTSPLNSEHLAALHEKKPWHILPGHKLKSDLHTAMGDSSSRELKPSLLSSKIHIIHSATNISATSDTNSASYYYFNSEGIGWTQQESQQQPKHKSEECVFLNIISLKLKSPSQNFSQQNCSVSFTPCWRRCKLKACLTF